MKFPTLSRAQYAVLVGVLMVVLEELIRQETFSPQIVGLLAALKVGLAFYARPPEPPAPPALPADESP